MNMEFEISTTWDGDKVKHDPVNMHLEECTAGIRLNIKAPYFDDPAPSGNPGEPQWLLWEYEVVELFFLNSKSGEYLELEYGPHGQHLGLIFKKWRDFWKKNLPLDFTSNIDKNEGRWSGSALIPWDYLPQGVDKYNAYAIHGVGDSRQYQALFPVPKGRFAEPDFHKLEYFGDINPKEEFPGGLWTKSTTSIWNYEA